MRVSTALLCDAATAREGLLNVLHGGITRLNAITYPWQFQGALGLILTLHPTEAGTSHNFQLLLQSEDGNRLMQLQGDFSAESSDIQPGEELTIPLAINFAAALLKPGRYSFEILIDNIHQTSLAFLATDPATRPAGGQQ